MFAPVQLILPPFELSNNIAFHSDWSCFKILIHFSLGPVIIQCLIVWQHCYSINLLVFLCMYVCFFTHSQHLSEVKSCMLETNLVLLVKCYTCWQDKYLQAAGFSLELNSITHQVLTDPSSFLPQWALSLCFLSLSCSSFAISLLSAPALIPPPCWDTHTWTWCYCTVRTTAPTFLNGLETWRLKSAEGISQHFS